MFGALEIDERRYQRDLETDEAIAERCYAIGAEIVRERGALAEYLADKGWPLGDLLLSAGPYDAGGDAESLLLDVLSLAGAEKPEPAYVCARLQSVADRIADVLADQQDVIDRARNDVCNRAMED